MVRTTSSASFGSGVFGYVGMEMMGMIGGDESEERQPRVITSKYPETDLSRWTRRGRRPMLVTLEPCFRLRRRMRMIGLHGGRAFSDQDGRFACRPGDQEQEEVRCAGEGCPNQVASQPSTLSVAFVDKGKFGKIWQARDRKLRTTSMVISRVGPLRRCLEDASEESTRVIAAF